MTSLQDGYSAFLCDTRTYMSTPTSGHPNKRCRFQTCWAMSTRKEEEEKREATALGGIDSLGLGCFLLRKGSSLHPSESSQGSQVWTPGWGLGSHRQVYCDQNERFSQWLGLKFEDGCLGHYHPETRLTSIVHFVWSLK